MSKEFYFIQFSLASVRSLNTKTVLLQRIQFSISIHLSSIWPIDRTLSSATNSGQSESGSDGNNRVLRIPQSFSITGTTPSDCLESYLGHSLRSLTPRQRNSRCILQPQPTGQLSLGFQCIYIWLFYLDIDKLFSKRLYTSYL